MTRRPPLLTLDGITVGIAAVHLAQPADGILEGGLDFVWRVCVDDAPERIRKIWGGAPIHMLRPRRSDPKQDRPPRWRIAARLENGIPVKPYDPKAGEMEGSHLTLIFFRNEVFDQPLDDIIALAAAQVEWKKHANDWGF